MQELEGQRGEGAYFQEDTVIYFDEQGASLLPFLGIDKVFVSYGSMHNYGSYSRNNSQGGQR